MLMLLWKVLACYYCTDSASDVGDCFQWTLRMFEVLLLHSAGECKVQALVLFSTVSHLALLVGSL